MILTHLELDLLIYLLAFLIIKMYWRHLYHCDEINAIEDNNKLSFKNDATF